MLAATWGRWQTGKKATFILSSLQTCEGTDSSYFNRVWGGFFNCLSPTRTHTHALILHLAGNDMKASLLLPEMERRSLSISNRASFLCFENGMFNTMKSLSPAPSFSVMGSKLQQGALFMGRFACAGMRTKEGRKLALECHAGDNGRFQQTQPGNGGLSWDEAALQGCTHQRNLERIIKQMRPAPWTLLC